MQIYRAMGERKKKNEKYSNLPNISFRYIKQFFSPFCEHKMKSHFKNIEHTLILYSAIKMERAPAISETGNTTRTLIFGKHYKEQFFTQFCFKSQLHQK